MSTGFKTPGGKSRMRQSNRGGAEVAIASSATDHEKSKPSIVLREWLCKLSVNTSSVAYIQQVTALRDLMNVFIR